MIKVKNITKRYKQEGALRGIDSVSFEACEGEVVCILGASGSGKTTLLRCLAGLEALDKGEVGIADKRSVGFVSQDYTLWPHLTVLQNLVLASVLRKKKSREHAEGTAVELLKRFDLNAYKSRYPHELSGGQRQRVAILRAVMMEPEILLLDEITSALDPELVKSVLDLIRALTKDGYTMIIATHHLDFAMSVASRIIFLKEGMVIQDSSATSFFTKQSDREIKSFIRKLANKDDSIEIFKGVEQYQAYHLQLINRLPEGSIIYVAGAVGDTWYEPMGELYAQYEKIRHRKNITWKMVAYEQGAHDQRIVKERPDLNQFRKMPRKIKNPANYNVFGDTVITQIFEDEPTIIQIKNQKVADAYLRFFEELWTSADSG